MQLLITSTAASKNCTKDFANTTNKRLENVLISQQTVEIKAGVLQHASQTLPR
jgi:hypothetical protein